MDILKLTGMRVLSNFGRVRLLIPSRKQDVWRRRHFGTRLMSPIIDNTDRWTSEMKCPATDARGLQRRRSPTYILGLSVTADTIKLDKISEGGLGRGADG